MASLNPTSPNELRPWFEMYDDVHIDLGTGDGAYPLHLARATPDMAIVGIDTCLDNLSKAARRGLPNLRFVACDATKPPVILHGVATSISINFPFGSLLRTLMDGEIQSRQRLLAVAGPGACIEIRVNGSAAKKLGLPLSLVYERLQQLARVVATCRASVTVEPHETFRRFPSEWAKRLAHGRPSQIVVATARLAG
jgi:16S rRNA (adenine(1408)-N(1))-methyltransferase